MGSPGVADAKERGRAGRKWDGVGVQKTQKKKKENEVIVEYE